MTWKEDKERERKRIKDKEAENQRQRDLHDAFWGRLKQPQQPREKENGD